MLELTIRKLHPVIGAEVTGIELRAPLDAKAISEIRELWLAHVVLCFPGQALRPRELLAFASSFGELDDNRSTPSLRHF